MELIHFILHVDQYLAEFITQYGLWVYAILFAIIFIETGLIVMPFLPGDSLLFTAGMFAAVGMLNPLVLVVLLMIAAIVGDQVNYGVGHHIGSRVYQMNSRWIKQDHLRLAQQFFVKHGGKSIILARFMPIIRTFVPFVAGASQMPYAHFAKYNVIGAVIWINAFVWAGYALGNVPVIRDHVTAISLGIVVLSVLPAVVAWLLQKTKAKASS
jgi:membrane-associated protein